MTEREYKNIWAIIASVAVAGVSALVVALNNGSVPIPSEYGWLVPIITAMLVAVIGVGAAASPQFKPNGGS
jgi:Flp pilus assembly pilin Flp